MSAFCRHMYAKRETWHVRFLAECLSLLVIHLYSIAESSVLCFAGRGSRVSRMFTGGLASQTLQVMIVHVPVRISHARLQVVTTCS